MFIFNYQVESVSKGLSSIPIFQFPYELLKEFKGKAQNYPHGVFDFFRLFTHDNKDSTANVKLKDQFYAWYKPTILCCLQVV